MAEDYQVRTMMYHEAYQKTCLLVRLRWIQCVFSEKGEIQVGGRLYLGSS